MNIRHSKPAFTTLFAALVLGTASLAGAAESGLSFNEQAAQNAIVAVATPAIVGTSDHADVATLAQNENAAQRAIVVGHDAVSHAVRGRGAAAALVINERAAQRAIVDAPRASHAMAKPVATKPVAVR